MQARIAITGLMLGLLLQGCAQKAVAPEAPPARHASKRLTHPKPRKPGQPELLFPRVETPAEEPEVIEALKFYQGPGRKSVLTGWANRAPFISTVQLILRQHGLPVELSNVAMIESGFDIQARSPEGPLGIWQFSKRTARFYGLRVDDTVDQRLDVAASTGAAARYLSDLYDIYGDWNLAVAAFNCGDGRLTKLLRDSGAQSFFELSRKGVLPPVTQQFVPRFLALSAIESDPKRWGFPKPPLPAAVKNPAASALHKAPAQRTRAARSPKHSAGAGKKGKLK